MNLKNATMSGTVLALSGFAPVVGAAAIASNAPAVSYELSEEKEVSGSISAVGMGASFTLTDAEDNANTITTNEKTSYMLDGEEATRAQVIVKGADVRAKVNQDGLAVRVHRVTE